MRSRIAAVISLLVVLGVGTGAWAADAAPTTNIGSITADTYSIPAIPAASMLNVDPSLVDSPETPKKIFVSLHNKLSSSLSPGDAWALQLNPALIFSNKRETLDTAINRGHFADSLDTLSFSMAVVSSNGVAPVSVVSDAAFAVKMDFASGKFKDLDKLKELRKTYYDAYDKIGKSAVDAASSSKIDFDDPTVGKLTFNPPDADVQAWKTAKSNFVNSLMQTEGFVSSGAIGIQSEFRDKIASTGKITNVDGWVNAGWTTSYIDFLGVTRIVAQNESTERKALLDVAGKLNLHYQKFSLAVEATHRFGIPDKSMDDGQYVATLGYRTTSATEVKLDLGRGFRDPQTLEHQLLAGLQLAFDFGSPVLDITK